MSEFKSDSSVNRVMKNGVFTALRFAVFTLSGIFFIPFLVKQYGSGTYGLIALAGFLTQYVGFISRCIGSSIGRFLNIALNKGDWQQANEIFSTAIVANLVVVLLQIPFFIIGIWRLDLLIQFPAEIASEFRFLVGCNVAIFFISILLGVLRTPIQATNRLDIGLKVDVIGMFIKLTVLILMITKIGPKLWIIGVVDLVMTIASIGITFAVYRHLARNLVFGWKYVTRKWIRPVVSMAGWTVVAELGQILFLKTDVWIINRFVDIKLAGICAALLLWPNFVQQIAKNVSTLIMPVVMIDYAQGRIGRIRDMVLLLSRLFAIMSLFMCGGAILFGGGLLNLWMGESYRQYQWFLILMLLHFPLTLSREAYWPIFPAFNKMQYIGISNIVSGVLNIVLSIVFVFCGFGLSGVIIATGVSLILQRTLFLSYFSTKLLDIKYREFLGIYKGGFVLLVAFAVQYFLFKNGSLMILGILAIAYGGTKLGLMYFNDPTLTVLLQSLLAKKRSKGAETS